MSQSNPANLHLIAIIAFFVFPLQREATFSEFFSIPFNLKHHARSNFLRRTIAIIHTNVTFKHLLALWAQLIEREIASSFRMLEQDYVSTMEF